MQENTLAKMRYLERFYPNICTHISILYKLAKYKISNNPCEPGNPKSNAHPAHEVTLKSTVWGPVWG